MMDDEWCMIGSESKLDTTGAVAAGVVANDVDATAAANATSSLQQPVPATGTTNEQGSPQQPDNNGNSNDG